MTSQPLDNSIVNKLLHSMNSPSDGRDRLYIKIGLFTAMRIGEILKLKWHNLLAPDGTARNSIYYRKGKAKKEKYRYIIVHQKIKEEVIKEWHRQGRPSLEWYIFRPTRGATDYLKPISQNQIRNMLKKRLAKFGYKDRISSHTLRKTFARNYFDSNNQDGRGLVRTMHALGHGNPSVTMRYIGLTEGEVNSGIQNLSYSCEKKEPVASHPARSMEDGLLEYKGAAKYAAKYLRNIDLAKSFFREYLDAIIGKDIPEECIEIMIEEWKKQLA